MVDDGVDEKNEAESGRPEGCYIIPIGSTEDEALHRRRREEKGQTPQPRKPLWRQNIVPSPSSHVVTMPCPGTETILT